jgi:hypothetical protein
MSSKNALMTRWTRLAALVAGLLAVLVALPAGRASAGLVEPPPVGSHPAVLGSPDSGNMAVFFNTSGTVNENFFFGSTHTWGGAFPLPGSGMGITESPVAVGNPNGGNMAVFFNAGGALMYDVYLVGNNTWNGPFEVSSDIQGDPSVVGDPNGGNMAVFWRDSHKHLLEDFYFVSSNTWGGAFPISLAIDDSPVAVGNPNGGNLAVYYTNGGVLQYNFYLVGNNTWNGPFQIATDAKGPAAVLGSPDSGNTAVFYAALINGTNQLREVFFNGSTQSWSGPFLLPGTPANGPVAAIGSPNGGNIAVFYDNTPNGLLDEDFYTVATNSWSGPTPIGGQIASPAQPAAAGGTTSTDNRAVFFTDGATGQLTDLAQDFFTSAGGWSGPTLIGGHIT